MGFSWDDITGHDREQYNTGSAGAQGAATENGAYGSTGRLQQLGQGAAPTLDVGNYNQDRGQQLGYVSTLTNAANGLGPSAAQMAGQQSRDASLTQASALQAGRRGSSAAAGARMAGMQSGAGIQNANAQQAMGQANEMATARGQLGGALSNLAGQDIGVASANQNAYLTNQGQQISAESALQNQAQAEMNARLTEQGMYANSLNPGTPGVLPNLISAGGSVAGAALLAKGGYIDHPTVAVIGEAGPEMVVPLSRGHEDMQGKALSVLAQIAAKDGGLPHMADGGFVDPNGYLQRAQTSNYVPHGYVDWRSTGEKVGDSLAQAAQTVANVIIAKKMGDHAKQAQAKKDMDAERAFRASHGGHTQAEIDTDPRAAADYARSRADRDITVQRAHDQAYRDRGLDPATGQPLPPPPTPDTVSQADAPTKPPSTDPTLRSRWMTDESQPPGTTTMGPGAGDAPYVPSYDDIPKFADGGFVVPRRPGGALAAFARTRRR